MNAVTKIEPASETTAEGLAHEILIWIASDSKLLERFLDLSGIKADEIRSMLGQRELYAGLTGFLMNHEPTLMAFCSQTGNRAEWIGACHQVFVPDDIFWT